MNVLVTAASQQGATHGIAEAIARTLRTHGLDATVAHPEDVLGIEDYDAVVIGSAIYRGHWLEPATEFVVRFAAPLKERQVWLFSSGPVGDPNRRFVQKMTADPLELPELLTLTSAREHRVFAGKLVSKGSSRSRRLSLLVFRGIEGDWRDWHAIEEWAVEISVALAGSSRQAAADARAGGAAC